MSTSTKAPEFLVVIPARLGSTRLPRKPLADLGGKPMVVRVAERAKQSNAQSVVVATDSAEIQAACDEHRIECLLTNPDHPTGTDRIAEVAQLLKLPANALIVNVQGDEPLIPAELINQVAQTLAANTDCAIATVATPIMDLAEIENPNVVKVVLDAHNTALYFSRAPIAWWRDGFTQGINALPTPAPLRHVGLYGYRVGFLREFPKLAQAPIEVTESLEQLRAMWHGHRIAVHVTDHSPGPGVDTPEDLARVRSLLSTAA